MLLIFPQLDTATTTGGKCSYNAWQRNELAMQEMEEEICITLVSLEVCCLV